MATGKPTGRPPRYRTVEDMSAVIDAYFKSCEGKPLLDKDGKAVLDKYSRPVIIGQKPPTVTGLALALGFTSRQALLNYQAKRAFVDTITRAKSRVEQYAEERLFDREGVRGSMFSLSNNFKGWSIRPESDVLSDASETASHIATIAELLKNPKPNRTPDTVTSDGEVKADGEE